MTTLIQRSFSSGEVAPALYAHADMAKYASGLRTMRNTSVLRHGGGANRPGTTFVAEVKDSTKAVRLIEFVFNASQTYICEFGDQYIRFHKNGVQLTESAKNITAATKANPCVITSNGHGFSNGNEVAIASVGGMTQLNNRNFKVANVTANTFSLTYMDGTAVDSTAFTTYTSGGTASRVYTLASTYLAADLAGIKYVQSGDVITLVHASYPPRELARVADTSWTLTTITFAPTIAAPAGVSVADVTGGALTFTYHVTAVAAETYEESLAGVITQVGMAAATGGNPHTVTWSAVSGALQYNIYEVSQGVAGFIGTSGTTSFANTGLSIDTTNTPPQARNPFPSAGNYPSAVGYFQQRLSFANTNNNTEGVWCSRSGRFKNFTISNPLQDDDAVTFTLAGRQVSGVQHLLDLGKFVILTSAGAWVALGDQAGVLKPTEINSKQQAFNGSNPLRPILAGSNALYVQARGSIVRDLGYDFQIDGYRGNDLTIFSAHLVDRYTIVDWAYQEIPHSVVWMVRSDGTLLGLTYVREQQIAGWHRHDFDGTVENVCAAPEGTEDAVYLVIKRTVNGKTVRYIERMASRQVDDVIDSIFMDAALSFDGRNTDSTKTMTLSGGTAWDNTETLTLTSNASFFAASYVGDQIQLTGSDNTILRFTIAGYTSATVVTGTVQKLVPVVMRSVAISDWARAVAQVGGLWHLEGKAVSVLADRFVVASPNNASYVARTVSSGILTLDQPYAVIHVGLPYISDVETLDVDTAQGQTVSDKKKLVGSVTAELEDSRGLWAGASPPSDDSVDPLEGLEELKIRSEESQDDPVALITGPVTVNVQPQWNSNGRVFLRQVDPLPLTVLSVAPAGYYPFTGGG